MSRRKGKRTLITVCDHYKVRHDGAHNAAADALASARIAWKIAATYPSIRARTLPELHADQITWAAEQAASLQGYFAKQGKPETVDGAWPLRRREQRNAA